MKILEGLTFDDVLIVPQYSEIESRSLVDLSTKIGNIELSLPIISSNMATITEDKMAATMALCGCLGVLHRFCTIDQNIELYQKTIKTLKENNYDKNNVGVSIGVDEGLQRFEKLYESGARFFVIDVAHGDHKKVYTIIKEINKLNLNDITLVAGNICTSDAAKRMEDCGIKIVKVGIGNGSVCVTRINTGVGYPQLSALEQIANVFNGQIISDGGVRHVGDIAKALVYADAVMIGSMFSGTTETPGKVFRRIIDKDNFQYYKVYQGSASARHKLSSTGKVTFVEGITIEVPFKGKVKYIIDEIRDGLSSAFSYVGAKNLKEFQSKATFVKLSLGSQKETKLI